MKDQTIRKNNNPKARKESKRKTSDGGAAEDNERLTIRKELQSFFRKYGGRLITVLFFVMLFVFGLFFLPNVNGNFDENAEQHILLANIKDYAEAFHVDEVADAIHNKGVLAISVNPNRDHGIAAYYLFAPMLILKDSHPHIVSVAWHFYTYCLAFIGVIFFYLLMQYLFKNKKLSVILTMLYYFTPRMFVDSLHNNKDIVFMALLVAMIYFGVRFIKEKEFRWALFFAFVGAFVCNIKILGLLFVGVIGMGYIIDLTIHKKWSVRNFMCGLTAVMILFVLYLALTPAIWGDGRFALIEYIQYCLGNAVNFGANVSVMFEGVLHHHEKDPLPWYYIPKLMLVTLPIIISILFIISVVMIIVDFFRNIRSHTFDFNNYVFVLIMTMFLIPLCIAMFSNPNLYNGWRHFYFLYSLALIVGSYAAYKLSNYKKMSFILTILICLTVISDIFCLFRYGMANTAYYNFLLGTDDLAGVYEMDYYNVSSQEALRQFMSSGKFEENEDGKLYLYSSGFGEVVVGDMKTYITPSISQRIVVVTNDTLEKYQKRGKIIYNFSNPVYQYDDVSNYDLVYTYRFFNNSVINIYKM